MLRKVVYEGITTFLLVFITSMTTNAMLRSLFFDINSARSLIIGIQYSIYYYAGYRISGGVLNPSISLGLIFTKKVGIVQVS